MTCEHCATSIQDALNALQGVIASVSYEDGMAQVQTQGNLDDEQLLQTIERNGYGVTLLADDNSNRKNNINNRLHIAIVGAGSGAFAAAIKATERGATVTLIERGNVIGGTCVNIGCVPSKILIRGGHVAHLQGHHAVQGVALNIPEIDRKKMVVQQQDWVKKLRYSKYENILKTNPGINLMRGTARFKNASTLSITRVDGSEEVIRADRILVAAGARPSIPDIKGLNDTPYWTSTEALIAEQIPEHLIILGASAIALELAQAFRHLGAKITLLARSTLLSKEDPQIGEGLIEIFNHEGIKVMLNTSPDLIQHDGQLFTLQTNRGLINGDQLLVATGRTPNTSELALDKVGVKTDSRGGIEINNYMRTNIETIFAVGDCTNLPQFVYVAAAAGTRAAMNMTNNSKSDDVAIDLSTMPAVIFTDPEVATVGLNEQQARTQGLDVESRTLELNNVPRALANMDTRGFIKLVAEKNSGRIIGCQILASGAGEVIQTAAFAIRYRSTVDELSHQLFPYLTMVEGLKLVAQTFTRDVAQLSCCAG